jgi:hypothetical protein
MAIEAEEEQLHKQTPWHLLSSQTRAVYAVADLAKRVKQTGEKVDVDCLLGIISTAIRALERSPKAKELMHHAGEWPTFAPGGPESGPLWRAWAKSFSRRHVGKLNPDLLLRAGKVDFAAGKPANLAKTLFEHLEPLRRYGPDPLLEELEAARAIAAEPDYMRAARSLPELAPGNIRQWCDLSLKALEEMEPDWRFWLQSLPGRQQTAKTRSQVKADKGAKYGTGQASETDMRTAKNLVSGALMEGFRSLLKSM